MAAYYNEFNPHAAHMLRGLIKGGLIADGEVDERSITEVSSDDIKGFTQHHFFAGIGGWSVALRIAGWDDARSVWTGSCPCQPFSSAGKQEGHGDERHLWPHWGRLIRECRPSVIFGEQVANAVAYGWWDDVASDLETEGYACAAAVLPACSVGRPHKRDRLWFVANGNGGRCEPSPLDREHGKKHYTQSCGPMANTECGGRQGQGPLGEPYYSAKSGAGQANQPLDDSAGLKWLACPDGKARPVEPSIRLLAHGVQFRAPILHGFGNAIVPEVAAQFIIAAGA